MLIVIKDKETFYVSRHENICSAHVKRQSAGFFRLRMRKYSIVNSFYDDTLTHGGRGRVGSWWKDDRDSVSLVERGRQSSSQVE